MRLSYVAELIAVLAVGMALAGAAARAMLAESPVQGASFSLRESVVELGPVFLAGLAVAGGVGLLVESVRGRSPQAWGAGRWVWSIAALYGLVTTLSSAIFQAGAEFSQLGGGAQAMVETCDASWAEFGPLLIVAWLVARFARVPRASGADARELTGRILAAAIILQAALLWANERWPQR